MATMPNVVGLILTQAEQALKTAGVLVPASIGYFGTGNLRTQAGTTFQFAAATWPITVNWVNQEQLTGTVDGLLRPTPVQTQVLTQSPAAGTTVAANSTVTLTAVQPAIPIAYPGTNLTNGFGP